MSSAKNIVATDATAKDEKVTAEVPAQKKPAVAEVIADAVAADTMIDALKTVEDQLKDGVTVKVQVAKDGSVSLEVVEATKVAKLIDSAKGVFKRNKKLVIAGAAMLATSVVLRAVAARQETEDDEVVDETPEADTTA